ncbi:hypothetical protein Q4493_13455 [Colwellia sp. 1_MG-2023]|uniref:transporter substrate-binding domain-containing protein n=1 Tax=Colwellia sp. 1_MG-2023 TaxID=3062649 RepID=UPI0026E32C97|nr:transporter substrate-binding domain-containing protein [Colwellia sp. 1_MG-2023]MDO6446785.1 hypothetical protein [Colwellia sp. 1_MG-2023]
MKFIWILILFSTSSFAKTITLSRGHDAALQSFSELVLHDAYQKIGIQLNIIHTPVGRSLLLANNGEVDGEVSRIINIEKEYKNLIRVPVPINYVDIRMFSYNKILLMHNADISSFYRIGCVKGVILIKKIISELDETCQSVTGFKQAVAMLNQNKLDAILLPLSVGLYFKKADSQFFTSFYGDTLGSEPLFHYLHKKHYELVPKLTAILNDMDIDFITKSYKDSSAPTLIESKKFID